MLSDKIKEIASDYAKFTYKGIGWEEEVTIAEYGVLRKLAIEEMNYNTNKKERTIKKEKHETERCMEGKENIKPYLVKETTRKETPIPEHEEKHSVTNKMTELELLMSLGSD